MSAARLRATALVLVAMALAGCTACDGGLSSLFEKQYSIADQVASAEKAAVFIPTPAPTRVDSVKVSETATLSATPIFTIGDGRNGHPLKLTGSVTPVLPLRNGRMALLDRAARELHIIDSTGQWLGSQPARVPPSDLMATVFRYEQYFSDVISRGDTVIALTRIYGRGINHTIDLLVAGKPELTSRLADLDIDLTVGEADLLGVTQSLDVFVHRLTTRTGARYFSQPRHTVLRTPTSNPADSTTHVVQYSRLDSLLSINDGGRVFRPIFGAGVAAAMSDSLFFLVRDTAPRIEIFDLNGAAVRTLQLEIARVPATPEAFNRRFAWIFENYGGMDSALKAIVASYPSPAQQPVIAGLTVSPDGQLLVLRDDLGWDAPTAEQRHVFDIFDASLRHVGRGSIDRAESIMLFKPPMLCTSHYQPNPPDSARRLDKNGELPPRPGLVTCYRVAA